MKKYVYKLCVVLAVALFLAVCALTASLCAGASGSAYALDVIDEDDPVVSLSELVGFANKDDYRLDKKLEVGYGFVYRFVRTVDGMDVLGADVAVSVDEDGNVLSFSGEYSPLDNISPAKLTQAQALSKLQQKYPDAEFFDCASVIFAHNARLGEHAYIFTSSVDGGSNIVVSAQNGETLSMSKFTAGVMTPTTQQDRDGNSVEMDVSLQNGTYVLEDEMRNFVVYDANGRSADSSELQYLGTRISSSTPNINDPKAVTVYKNLQEVYDFYTDPENLGVALYGMRGDNDNTPGNHLAKNEYYIKVFVNFGDKYENAYYQYSGDQFGYICIGNGNQSGIVYDLAYAKDVISHEYQHGVTTFAISSTFGRVVYGLAYEFDSGAIDEAASDIFGAIIEGKPMTSNEFWYIGEDCMTDESLRYGDLALRSMKGSLSIYDQQKYNVSDKKTCAHASGNHTSDCDNGGVHLNSTILTHAQYLMYEKMPSFFTEKVIGNLWYSTLCSLKYNSTFDEFAINFLQAAKNLGYSEEVQNVIASSFAEVGITMNYDNHHLVRFLNDDGSVFEAKYVEDKYYWSDYIPKTTPKKAPTERYEYEFSEWQADKKEVTEDIDVRPVFTQKDRYYTVRFLNKNNSVLKEEKVLYEGSATPPSDPVYIENGDYDYVFDRWEGDYTLIRQDTDVIAVYNAILCHTVRFLVDGEVFASLRVQDGLGAATFNNPQKPSDEKYDYIFLGWNADTSEVHEDMDVVAMFNAKPREYKITFVIDGKVYSQKTAHYGDKLVLSSPSVKLGKSFVGWSLSDDLDVKLKSVDINGDITLYGGYKSAVWHYVLLAVAAAIVIALCVTVPLLLAKRARKK